MNKEVSTVMNKNEFLLALSNNAMYGQTSMEMADCYIDLFKRYYAVKNMELLILDFNNGLFRDFVKDWIYVEDKDRHKTLTSIFKNFYNQNTDKFIINGRLSSFTPDEAEKSEIRSILRGEGNLFYYPLFSADKSLGLIEIEFDGIKNGIKSDGDFFLTLQLALLQISTSVMNHIIKEHMATGLNFYNAMKNIAKIIESQYELDYIVPQIGEMLDRFISSHLIYIFTKNETGEFKLLWPTSCKTPEITELLKQITVKHERLVSPDRKIGIFPLKTETEILGAIVTYSTIGKLSGTETEYLLQLTQQSSITIQRANVYSEVLKHATLDALTGLNNRRQFEVRLKQETSQSQRKGSSLCCIMIDVDYFKRVNDTYGHTAGDCVLKGIAKLITTTLREYDIPCRYGGEEFFILLPQTTLDETVMVAERLRTNIMSSQIDIRDAKIRGIPTLSVTVSIGVNKFLRDKTAEEFYQGADKALYEAKTAGRNRVMIYQEAVQASEESVKKPVEKKRTKKQTKDKSGDKKDTKKVTKKAKK